jgi:hypothetical protein
MLDLTLVRNRLLSVSGPTGLLRDIQVSTNIEDAMREAVRAPRAWVMELGESFGKSGTHSILVSQICTAEFGVLIAVPDVLRGDQVSPLAAPRQLVRSALLGWAPDGLTAIEARRGRLMAAGPVQWWLDSFSTDYIVTGAGN